MFKMIVTIDYRILLKTIFNCYGVGEWLPALLEICSSRYSANIVPVSKNTWNAIQEDNIYMQWKKEK